MANVGEHTAVIYGTHFPNRLFVGCLPETATALELGSHFGQFGKVLEAKVLKDDIGRSKRFGFVSFQHEESVKRVLKERPIRFKGKTINVGPAVKKDGTDTPKSVTSNSTHDSASETQSDGSLHATLPNNSMNAYQATHLSHQHFSSIPMMTTSQTTVPTTYIATNPRATTQMTQYPAPWPMFPVAYQSVANAAQPAMQGAYLEEQHAHQRFLQNQANQQFYYSHQSGKNTIASSQGLYPPIDRQLHQPSFAYLPLMNCVF